MSFKWLSIVNNKGDISGLGGTAQQQLQPLAPSLSLTSVASETPIQAYQAPCKLLNLI